MCRGWKEFLHHSTRTPCKAPTSPGALTFTSERNTEHSLGPSVSAKESSLLTERVQADTTQNNTAAIPGAPTLGNYRSRHAPRAAGCQRCTMIGGSAANRERRPCPAAPPRRAHRGEPLKSSRVRGVALAAGPARHGRARSGPVRSGRRPAGPGLVCRGRPPSRGVRLVCGGSGFSGARGFRCRGERGSGCVSGCRRIPVTRPDAAGGGGSLKLWGSFLFKENFVEGAIKFPSCEDVEACASAKL